LNGIVLMERSLELRLLLAFLFLFAFKVNAQEDLFGKQEKVEAKKGWLITFNANLDFPAADMAKRFGISNRFGPSVYYKTQSNWIFGAKCDFIFGGQIRDDSLMVNIKDKYGSFLTSDGKRIGVPTFERGYMIGLEAGKIITLSDKRPDNGILFLTSGGFIQHKINIYDADQSVAQLRGDYLKGYDRLTNGLFLEEYVGYVYFARNKLINFHIGIDGMFGFTQGRRDYLFDVMRPDNKQRLDILFGLRGGFYIPIFKRKTEEIFY